MDELNSFGKNYAQAWSSQKPEDVSKFFAPNGSLTANSCILFVISNSFLNLRLPC